MVLIISSLMPLGYTDSGFIREYRSNLGLDGYSAGEAYDIVSFAIFAVILYVFQIIVSIKVFRIHRRFSLVVLLLTLVTLLFALLANRSLLSFT